MRANFLYDQQKVRPSFQRAWEDNKKFKVDQRKKGAKPPFFKINPQGQKMPKEVKMIDTGSQGPRQPPMQCWGCKGDHRFKDCPHKGEKVGLFTMYSELKQWRTWAYMCQGFMQPWKTRKQSISPT
jgi:hypothetical protein